MIAVNLLPLEMRRLERTPLPRRLVIFGSVGINFIGLLLLVTLQASSIPAARSAGTSYKQQIYQLATIRKVDEAYKALVAAKQDFERRKATIQRIEDTRILWAEKLDHLWNLVPATIWFSSIELKEPEVQRATRGQEAAKPTGSLLVITGYTAGTNIGEVTKFIKLLQQPAADGGKSFYDDFVKIYDPKFEKDGKTFKDYNNAVAMKFTITLELKPTQGEQPSAPAAAPARHVSKRV